MGFFHIPSMASQKRFDPPTSGLGASLTLIFVRLSVSRWVHESLIIKGVSDHLRSSLFPCILISAPLKISSLVSKLLISTEGWSAYARERATSIRKKVVRLKCILNWFHKNMLTKCLRWNICYLAVADYIIERTVFINRSNMAFMEVFPKELEILPIFTP